MLGPLCNQTVNLETDAKTLHYSLLKLKFSPLIYLKHKKENQIKQRSQKSRHKNSAKKSSNRSIILCIPREGIFLYQGQRTQDAEVKKSLYFKKRLNNRKPKKTGAKNARCRKQEALTPSPLSLCQKLKETGPTPHLLCPLPLDQPQQLQVCMKDLVFLVRW